MEFHENPDAQTVDTRPFFFLPRAKRATRLPAREKRGAGDEATSVSARWRLSYYLLNFEPHNKPTYKISIEVGRSVGLVGLLACSFIARIIQPMITLRRSAINLFI